MAHEKLLIVTFLSREWYRYARRPHWSAIARKATVLAVEPPVGLLTLFRHPGRLRQYWRDGRRPRLSKEGVLLWRPLCLQAEEAAEAAAAAKVSCGQHSAGPFHVPGVCCSASARLPSHLQVAGSKPAWKPTVSVSVYDCVCAGNERKGPSKVQDLKVCR